LSRKRKKGIIEQEDKETKKKREREKNKSCEVAFFRLLAGIPTFNRKTAHDF